MPKRLLIISFSPIKRDPRVMRQARLAVERGLDLCVIGYGEPGDAVPGLFIPLAAPIAGPTHRLATAMRQGPSLLLPQMSSRLYWSSSSARQARAAAAAFRPHFIHANDWSALPVAAAARCPFLYDSHEFASGEQVERLAWRLLFKPYVCAIEARFIGLAARVCTVSEGIAEKLQSTYGLPTRPAVIRNVPPYQEVAFHPTGPIIDVLYQGAYNSDRGLENLIDSVAAWRPEFQLTLRGIGSAAFERTLRARAAASPAAQRIVFAEPVKSTDLIAAAARSDVGIHPIPPATIQTDYCLPNKFFEYIIAGLCICVSPAQEMAALVRHYDTGMVMGGTDAAMIAKAVNGLTRQRIDAAKRSSIIAARELNWEHEQHKLREIYDYFERAAACGSEKRYVD